MNELLSLGLLSGQYLEKFLVVLSPGACDAGAGTNLSGLAASTSL